MSDHELYGSETENPENIAEASIANETNNIDDPNNEDQNNELDEDAAIRSMPSFKKKRTMDDLDSERREANLTRDSDHSHESDKSESASVYEDQDRDEEPEYYDERRAEKKSRKSSGSRNKKSYSDDEQEDQPPLDAKALAIQELNRDIDFALKKGKASRRRKTNEISTSQDEEIHQMQEKMRNAADADFEDNKMKLPAIHKVQLLNSVTSFLGKPHLYESLLDNNILDTIRLWLEPLDDGSLPNIDIQNALLLAMTRLPIQTDHLRDSGIGKIVLFMSKCSRYPERHRRIADQLVQAWARPILRRSSNFRDKVIDESAVARGGRADDPARTGIFGRIQVQSGNSAGGHSFFASIPQKVSTNYNIMPKSNLNSSTNSNSNSVMPEKFKRIKAHMTKIGRK
ncbi:Transcription factor IWS1 [Smittium mucronatum]|uniref:Transcription factor IWS1 n=1 Tax=Smittium mucronatum TaxID=133383 RepID=A0A1R0GVB5_9FUNG|nr:Transcription factor IWS1 [Smittium mucronatum]